MDDLIAFINARLDEDEAAAKGPPGWKLEHWTAIRYADKESGRNWRVDAEPRCVIDGAAKDDAQFIARHDPARALREAEAKRAILDRHSILEDLARNAGVKWCAHCTDDRSGAEWPCGDVRDLAAVWSDHPGYRPEWGAA